MKRVNFRIEDNDHKTISDNAKSDNKTVSDYVRDRILTKAKSEAENREKETNIFIKDVQEIKTNSKIIFTKLSEIEGKISVTNDRIAEGNKQITERVVSLEKKIKSMEQEYSNLLNVVKKVVTK